MFSWFPCARATDAAEADARFAERGAREYVAKRTPEEQLVHREMAGFPPLVALRATFQHADPRARGTVDGGDFLFLLGIRRDAYAERLLERLDADGDGELRLVECVVELARLDEVARRRRRRRRRVRVRVRALRRRRRRPRRRS